MECNSNFVLGIDIGTTSVKMSLIDERTLKVKESKCCSYEFTCKNENNNFAQQKPDSILNAIQSTLNSFSTVFMQNVKCIGICGQMHGVILWQKNAYEYDAACNKYIIDSTKVSDLYTWQDKRCDEKFLQSLPESSVRVATGYGCATIFWLLRNQNEYLSKFSACGTIMDFVVTMICHLETPVISLQNAASFGFCDVATKTWNTASLQKANFPVDILPQIVDAETLQLSLANQWLNIASKTKVFVAFGDTQCAVYSAIRNRTEIAGTSMQLCLPMTDKNKINVNFDRIDLFPYFENKFLVVAASLNGGNVLQTFVDKLRDGMQQITGIDVSTETIWEKLISAALSNDAIVNKSEIRINPCIFGERHDPLLKGRIDNLSFDSNIAEVFAVTCRALIENIFSMITIDLLKATQVRTLLVTGNTFTLNPLLRTVLQKFVTDFKHEICIDVRFENEFDANDGAALFAASLLRKMSKD